MGIIAVSLYFCVSHLFIFICSSVAPRHFKRSLYSVIDTDKKYHKVKLAYFYALLPLVIVSVPFQNTVTLILWYFYI